MTQLIPALDAELRAPSPTVFGAVSIDLPDAQINLLDGAGVLSFGNRDFSGRDDTYGVLSAADNFTDGTGDTAPAFTLTLLPASDAAATALAAPEMQGAPVYVWIGAVSPATGLVIPDPHLIFAGEIDVGTLEAGEGTRTLDFDVVSVFERLFEDDESARLSPGFHRSIFPNEAGLGLRHWASLSRSIGGSLAIHRPSRTAAAVHMAAVRRMDTPQSISG